MDETREWQIGPWVFDAVSAQLKYGQREVPLEHRTAQTLELLCRHRGRPVSRDDILTHVWAGRSVSANSVAIVIADLRRALGDDAGAPRFIATLPKRGYRLAEEAAAAVPPVHLPVAHRTRVRLAIAIVATLVACAALLVALGYPAPQRVTVVVAKVTNDTGRQQFQPLAVALQDLVTDRLAGMDLDVVLSADEAAAKRPARTVWFKSRLIVWNGITTLSMQATDNHGRVRWTAMVVAPPDAIAAATMSKLKGFGQVARAVDQVGP